MKLSNKALEFCLLSAAVLGTSAFQSPQTNVRHPLELNAFGYDPGNGRGGGMGSGMGGGMGGGPGMGSGMGGGPGMGMGSGTSTSLASGPGAGLSAGPSGSGLGTGIGLGTGPGAEMPGDASPGTLSRGSMSPGSMGGNSLSSVGTQSPRRGRDLSSDGVTVQGGSLKTWSFTTPYIERVQVNLKTEGRPLNADIDLWHGPDNTPQKIAVYIEDGKSRPFNAVIETPRGQNAVAIRNTASLEYPLRASVETDRDEVVTQRPVDPTNSQIIQGGAIKTYTFAATVGSIAILMKTDGRPLNARIELLQGPNNNKQVVDLYTEDGSLRPFYSIIQTPGSGNVVRIVNTATMEYPLTCTVEPYEVETFDYNQGGSLSVDGFPFNR